MILWMVLTSDLTLLLCSETTCWQWIHCTQEEVIDIVLKKQIFFFSHRECCCCFRDPNLLKWAFFYWWTDIYETFFSLVWCCWLIGEQLRFSGNIFCVKLEKFNKKKEKTKKKNIYFSKFFRMNRSRNNFDFIADWFGCLGLMAHQPL